MPLPLAVILALILGGSSLLGSLYFLAGEAHGTSNDLDAIRDIVLFLVTAGILSVNLVQRKTWARFLIIFLAVFLFFRWFRVFWIARSYGGQFSEGLLFAVGYLTTAGLLCTRSVAAWFPPYQVRQVLVLDIWQSSSHTALISWGLFAVSLMMIHSSAYGGGGGELFGLLGAVTGTILFVIYALESYEYASRSEGWPSIGRLLLSFSIFTVAVFYPSACIGYAFLVVFPVQMLTAVIVLAGLLKRGWNNVRASKPYFLTLVCMNIVVGFVGLTVVGLLTSGIQLH